MSTTLNVIFSENVIQIQVFFAYSFDKCQSLYMFQKPNHLFGKKIQELQKKLICRQLLNVKFCHLKNEKAASIGLPHPEVILPTYPNSTLVLGFFSWFSSFPKPMKTTSPLVFTASWLSRSHVEKNQGNLWDEGILMVSEQILCSSCWNGLQGLMADKPSGWNRQ